MLYAKKSTRFEHLVVDNVHYFSYTVPIKLSKGFFDMNIGSRIIALRKRTGMTRKDLALKLDMPETTLRNYELGAREPGHAFLVQISELFNVTTDYLLGLSEQENSTSAVYSVPALEVASAYDNADLPTRLAVRRVLELPVHDDNNYLNDDESINHALELRRMADMKSAIDGASATASMPKQCIK